MKRLLSRKPKRKKLNLRKKLSKPKPWKWSRKKRKWKKKLRRIKWTKRKWRKFWRPTTSCGRTKWAKHSMTSRTRWSTPRISISRTWKILTNSTRNWCRWMRPPSNRILRAKIKSTIVSRKYMIKRSRTYLRTRKTLPLSSKWEATRNNGLQITPLAKEKVLPQPWPI